MIIWSLLASIAVSASLPVRHFPQETKPLSNPQQTRALMVKEADAAGENHLLYVKTYKTLQIVDVLRFPRSVDVSWSANGSRFFVNNNAGSNRSECRVGEVLGDDSIRWISMGVKPALSCDGAAITDHCYLKCSSWVNDEKVSGTFNMYGESDKKARVEFVLRP